MSAASAADEVGPGGPTVHPGISAAVFDELTECNATLSQQRKKRQVSYIPCWYPNYMPFSLV